MPVSAAALDLERLDAAVEAAIAAGGPGALKVLGFGELTLVLAWPPESPVVAVKRLPPFDDPGRLARYGRVLRAYIGALEERGVRVLPTELQAVMATRGAIHAYLVQPLVSRANVLSVTLANVGRDEAGRLLEEVAAAVCAAVDARVGLDAQAGNWVRGEQGLACVDVSTPMMRGDDGREQLDVALFLSAYPWALRPALRRVADDLLAQYHDPRTVLVDVASNLIKEQLGHRVGDLLTAANRRVSPPISRDEVRRYFRSDRRLWLLMQRLRRADRAWQRRVRRRPYPFLLAPPYRYGPMTPPGGEPL
jgi:hypothetical protein